MIKTLFSLLLLLLLAGGTSGQALVTSGSGAPSGHCDNLGYINSTTGDFYDCINGVWHLTSQNTGSQTSVTTSISSAIPSGIIVLSLSACPAGFTELSSLSGRFALGTVAANSNVGTTGGADNITPAGTNSTVAFTPAGTNSAPTFTGNSGTIPAETISWPAGVPTHSGTTATFTGNAVVAASTNSGTKLVTGNTSTGVSPVTTATGTVTITSQGTIAWPAGVPTNGTVSFTPTGTNSAPTFTGSSGTIPAQTFTGTQFDNRSAFIRVIFCQKN